MSTIFISILLFMAFLVGMLWGIVIGMGYTGIRDWYENYKRKRYNKKLRKEGFHE